MTLKLPNVPPLPSQNQRPLFSSFFVGTEQETWELEFSRPHHLTESIEEYAQQSLRRSPHDKPRWAE